MCQCRELPGLFFFIIDFILQFIICLLTEWLFANCHSRASSPAEAAVDTFIMLLRSVVVVVDYIYIYVLHEFYPVTFIELFLLERVKIVYIILELELI